jgi:putative transposase
MQEHPEVMLFAVYGTENHVHLAVKIRPTVLISGFIGDMKGFSSHALNQEFSPQERFAWQAGYGVVTFGANHLQWVVNYIKKQKEHHGAGGKLQQRLEATEEDEPLPASQ